LLLVSTYAAAVAGERDTKTMYLASTAVLAFIAGLSTVLRTSAHYVQRRVVVDAATPGHLRSPRGVVAVR
jgi:hypothetical protein